PVAPGGAGGGPRADEPEPHARGRVRVAVVRRARGRPGELMLAEFTATDAADDAVGSAEWDGAGVRIDAEDPSVRAAIERIFAPTSVLGDAPSLRSFGTAGPALLAPGSLRWFLAAAESRSPGEGLVARLVPRTGRTLGWDPAGAYRTFGSAVERRERSAPK